MNEQRQPTHEEMVEGITKGVREALHDPFLRFNVHGDPMRLALKEAFADGVSSGFCGLFAGYQRDHLLETVKDGVAAGFRGMFDGRLSALTDAVRGGSAAGFVDSFRGRILSLVESVQAGVAKALGSAFAKGEVK